MKAPVFEDILEAAGRIRSVCIVTPLLESHPLNERIGGRLLVKAEGLQRTGSFKLRGAYNRMSRLTEEELRRGVVAYSSGNHGQAVAAAARLLGTTAVIIMPEDTPRTKVDKTLSHGAEVVHYDRYREDRAAIGREVASSRGRVLIPPFEDPHVIAGAGTLGREIVMQASELGVDLDALLVCCSGGGLTAGCAIAVETMSPATQVYAVEPVAFDDTARSLAAGTRVTNDPAARSICDAVQSPTPGELTFSINRRLLAGALTVTDEEVVDAMMVAARELGLVVEPGGAVALAAVLSRRLDPGGRTVAVTLSGSNVTIGSRPLEDHGGPVRVEIGPATGE